MKMKETLLGAVKKLVKMIETLLGVVKKLVEVVDKLVEVIDFSENWLNLLELLGTTLKTTFSTHH